MTICSKCNGTGSQLGLRPLYGMDNRVVSYSVVKVDCPWCAGSGMAITLHGQKTWENDGAYADDDKED